MLVMLAVAGFVIGLARIIWPDVTVVGMNSSAWWNAAENIWWTVAISLLISLIYDVLTRPTKEDFAVERSLPKSFALNRQQMISFSFENKSQRPLDVSLSDVIPSQFESVAFPLEQKVEVATQGIFKYSILPKQRGLAVFGQAYVLIRSSLGLWQFIYRLAKEDERKVYPDFSAISSSFVFGVEQTMKNMGAHIAKRKGDGMEFNQLRDFRAGDTLKQIDWKATARLGSPISREYQEEKDQNIVFLLDCSRRMRAVEQNLSYFDYALNALLLSSYIALDKGDAVGVMTFSGEPSWLPPVKGKASINQLLNHLYDLSTSTESSDYVQAAEAILVKHRKRSLIILITNVRDEDSDDLYRAVDVLSKQHLVMVVALQEGMLGQVNDLPMDTQDDVMYYAGVKHFEHARKKMLALLKARGISVVDATHKNIHIKLVTEYLALKQYGKI
ncbi:MAG: DUF58 domain-containing protein [Gammaproteobacteria bacterium]|nr:MAG: DUF58 domain-containing protein [Gammaproteobacteria bacterium]